MSADGAGTGPRGPPCGRAGESGAAARAPRDRGYDDEWPEVVRAVADAGADAVEIGILFRTP